MSWTPGYHLQSRPYIIESVLGSGGFGITYKVRHLEHNQYFVIKTPLDHLKHDPNYAEYLRRFQKEGEKLKRLCKAPHRHIVQVIDFFTEDENPCLVMEYIPGENLYQLVKQQGALTQTQAVKVICQIGDALIFMHQAELVHRDATPLNIMMRNPEEAVLIDFGIAKGINPKTSTQTDIAGNRSFAPYEQVGRGSREKTVDVYSLAASLYYAVTGECATASLDRKMFNEELVPPSQLNPSISDRLNQAILKGMALEPEDRPSSVREWLSLLGTSTKTNQNKEVDQKSTLPLSVVGTSQLKNRRIAGFAVVMLLVVGVPIGISLLPQNPPTEDTSISNLRGTAAKTLEPPPAESLNADYSQLENLLKDGKWKEADSETLDVMLEVAKRESEGWLNSESIDNFSCADLKKIDQLWVKYSNKFFGFSVQHRIWLSFKIKTDKKLGERLGWKDKKKGNWLEYHSMTFNLSAPVGHLPLGGNDFMMVMRFDSWESLFSRVQTCNL
ncbi:MAG: protein kinase [Symploca sp. SIO2E9]|nr:protein kinase [Symploca sp. SIO2E9]